MPKERAALLLVELDGDEGTLERHLSDVAAATERAGAAEIIVATDEKRRRDLWEMRRNISRVTKARCLHKMSEDVVVPRSALAEMLRRLAGIAAEYAELGQGRVRA